MKITYLAAGAGEMYCGACAHDVNLTSGLLAEGHDVQLVPLYTPIRTDLDIPPTTEIFLGGIGVFLRQQFPWLSLPVFVEKLLRRSDLLAWAGKRAVKTNPSSLGPMTVSILKGKNGKQKKDLETLLLFLEEENCPDIVHITNSLLSGIAPVLKERLGCPVVCNIQGEDGFLDLMPEKYRKEATELVALNAQYIDCFISPSEIYKQRVQNYFSLPDDKIVVIPPAINTDIYSFSWKGVEDTWTIGYLSRISPEKGLDVLVEAIVSLKKKKKKGVAIKLKVAGKIMDYIFWENILLQAKAEGIVFEYVGELCLEDKIKFLRECSLFCAPSKQPESRGTVALEAIALGVPVILPEAGVFPEILQQTKGGILFQSSNSKDLAEKIHSLSSDDLKEFSFGHKNVQEKYSTKCLAVKTSRLYDRVLSGGMDK